MTAETDERRSNPRVTFEGKAYLTYDGRCRCEGVADVSAEGLFLQTSVRIREGKQVKVFLPLRVDEAWRLCLLKGEVVRRVGRGGARGLGIAFVEGEVDTRGVLQAYVAGIAGQQAAA